MSWTLPLTAATGLLVVAGSGGAVPVMSPARPALLHMTGGEVSCAGESGAQATTFVASRDASVAGFARALHGTWVRRLTIRGVPTQTNSFLYVDMSGAVEGRGQALMIDRVNQGWDGSGLDAGVGSASEADRANAAGGVPATTGAYWSVSVRRAVADGTNGGRAGVMLTLEGDYRGTGDEYPRSGLHFSEHGTFYRSGSTYATRHPWQGPPQATGPGNVLSSGEVAASQPASEYWVVLEDGQGAEVGKEAPASGSVSRAAALRPTLTFVICQDGIIDRYHKISDAVPSVEGKSLKAAWDAALAAGLFDTVAAR